MRRGQRGSDADSRIELKRYGKRWRTVERPVGVAIAGELAGEKVNTLSLAGPITASLNSVRPDWLERVQGAEEELEVPADAGDPLDQGRSTWLSPPSLS